jgi:segregation and condensation protein B
MEAIEIKLILEAVLMASHEPLSLERLQKLFCEGLSPSKNDILTALKALAGDYQGRSIELKELASGYTFRTKESFSPFILKLWGEKPPRYSRALLETLALIAYRQPITRAEIEEVRGVAVSSPIMRQLTEQGWIEVVGHRDLPGKPSLFATTKEFLDGFNLKNLEELPSLDKGMEKGNVLGSVSNNEVMVK